MDLFKMIINGKHIEFYFYRYPNPDKPNSTRNVDRNGIIFELGQSAIINWAHNLDYSGCGLPTPWQVTNDYTDHDPLSRKRPTRIIFKFQSETHAVMCAPWLLHSLKHFGEYFGKSYGQEINLK